MFVAVIWCQNIDRCFAFNVVNPIHDVYIGDLSFCWFLITNEACNMSCDWVTFDFDGYDAIVSGRYLRYWFNNSYCHLLFTVLDGCEKFAILLYVVILFCISSMWQWEFLLYINAKKYLNIWLSVTNDAMMCEPEISYPEMKCCHSQCHQWQSICCI